MRLLTTVLSLFVVTAAFGQLQVHHLRVENLVNPVGLDVPPRFSWQISADRRNVLQTAYEIRVAADAAGLAVPRQQIWTSKKVMSDASVWAPYTGPAMASNKKYWWQVRVWDNAGNVSAWSEPAYWQMGLLKPADWPTDWVTTQQPEDPSRPSPMFRKTFSLNKKIVSATAYFTAHGLYEAWINGQRVGNDCLTPGWTAYQKRLQYQAYDITDLLRSGKNAVGVMLGSGWWRGYIGFSGQKDFYGKDLALLCKIIVTHPDGSQTIIGTDNSWVYTTDGPLRSADIYNGELYDSRMEKQGWSAPDFNDTGWKQAATQQHPASQLVGTYNEPVRKHETFTPKRIFRTPKGELVVDFGQNLTGWVILKANGKSGDKIVLQYAEVLDKQGNFYTENLRAALCTDTWILKGGPEQYESRFTFHGFRYARLEGYPGDLKTSDITAVALYSDMKPAGQFSCSDPLVNQLQHNIQWGQRGNFLDVPTDCPQRDERLGWTGDAQAFSRTAIYNFDVHNFYAKWLKDIAADQAADGMVPFVIPNVLGNSAGGSTGWADAATIIPWNTWLTYGDQRVLEDQYASMKAWVEYMRAKSNNDLWNTGFHFGDWLFYSVNDDRDGRSAITDKYLIAQCFYAHSTQLLINAATVLGKQEDVTAYAALLQKIKTAYLNEYITPNGRAASPTQTAYVLALQFDMLPENLREATAKRLVTNIKSYDNHLTTGFLGTPYLCHVLTRYGYNDLAYQLLNQKTYPSWLYPVTMGATTIWERWDGIKPDSTFQEASMNSFNHYAYGAIGDWMYRNMAGINLEQPGYKMSSIQPRPGGGYTQVSASYQTLYGTLSSHWQVEGNDLVMEVTIPANTTAKIYIPGADPSKITEGGQPLSAAQGIRVVGPTQSWTAVEAGSGQYRFKVAGGGVFEAKPKPVD